MDYPRQDVKATDSSSAIRRNYNYYFIIIILYSSKHSFLVSRNRFAAYSEFDTELKTEA